MSTSLPSLRTALRKFFRLTRPSVRSPALLHPISTKQWIPNVVFFMYGVLWNFPTRLAVQCLSMPRPSKTRRSILTILSVLVPLSARCSPYFHVPADLNESNTWLQFFQSPCWPLVAPSLKAQKMSGLQWLVGADSGMEEDSEHSGLTVAGLEVWQRLQPPTVPHIKCLKDLSSTFPQRKALWYVHSELRLIQRKKGKVPMTKTLQNWLQVAVEPAPFAKDTWINWKLSMQHTLKIHTSSLGSKKTEASFPTISKAFSVQGVCSVAYFNALATCILSTWLLRHKYIYIYKLSNVWKYGLDASAVD